MDRSPSPRPEGDFLSQAHILWQERDIVRTLLMLEGRSRAQADQDMSNAVNQVVRSLYEVEIPPSPDIVAVRLVYRAAWEIVLLDHSPRGTRSPWKTTYETPGPDDTSVEYRRYYEQQQANNRLYYEFVNRVRSLYAPAADQAAEEA